MCKVVTLCPSYSTGLFGTVGVTYTCICITIPVSQFVLVHLVSPFSSSLSPSPLKSPSPCDAYEDPSLQGRSYGVESHHEAGIEEVSTMICCTYKQIHTLVPYNQKMFNLVVSWFALTRQLSNRIYTIYVKTFTGQKFHQAWLLLYCRNVRWNKFHQFSKVAISSM